MKAMKFPIDAVITWVDGNDPRQAAKLKAWGDNRSFSEEDVAGKTRFASIGEIQWCVRSLRKFAPFIRTIFIVTDGQDPHIPEGNIPVRIIDHKEIFRGYEDKLPVFNSIAIESMTWRIPGLSEHYLELNDDFMLGSPVTPEDFFLQDGTPVCYAAFRSVLLTRLTRPLKRHKNGTRRITFKGTMLNGAAHAGEKLRFLKLDHTPRPLLRSFFETWYGAHPDKLDINISYRFRDIRQFSSEEVQYITLLRQKQLVVRPTKGNLFYLEPKPKKDYIKRKMERYGSRRWKFCCFNSLDKASEGDAATVISWIEKILAPEADSR